MSSNNMYNILNTLKSLEPTPEQTVKETARRIYESVEAQGSITEGVNRVEQTLNEKYMGFKAVEKAAKKGGAENPAAVAASVGRKKYGKKAFQKAAASGKKMHESQDMSEGHADQQRRVVKRNGKPVGEVGIDRESSPGAGQWYMKCYVNGIDQAGYDSMEEAMAELKHCLTHGMAESTNTQHVPIGQQMANDGITYSREKEGEIIDLMVQYMKKDGMSPKSIRYCLNYDEDYIPDQLSYLPREQGVAEGAKPDFLDLDHDGNEKESMKKAAKDRDGVRVHKGTYGTEYDPSDEEKKDKPKYVARQGVKGRKPAEKPAKAELPADPFGRTTGEVPKGKKGTRIKGKGNIDEVITKKTSAGEIIHDFQKSKNPKFAGKSKEQRKNQALGAYYGMHPEKSKKESAMDEGVFGNLANRGKEAWNTYQANRQFDRMGAEQDKIAAGKTLPGIGQQRMDAMQARARGYGDKAQAARLARTGSTLPKNSNFGGDQDMLNRQKLRQQGMAESAEYKKQNFLFESFNFANMMKETDQTVQEMLEELQKDISHYKMTGECSPKLDAFLRVHGHAKKQLADEAKMPKVLDKIGSAVKTGWEKLSHPSDDEMLDKLYKDTLPSGSSSAPDNAHAHDELDELAQLAGITDEGNAFTGKLAKTAHGDSFDLDGKTYKDTSQLDEETCNECGMYESQCSCTEGNLFTKKLAQTPKGGEFELDGKQYKDTSNLDETSMKLEDIAKLAGIAVEGKDYGDASFNPAPTYDNTPDEQVQGEDVLLKGGDGEVAGAEKKMSKDGAARFSDNPLAMKESEVKSTDLMKEAATFDPIEAMGRKLMKQYESIKLQK